MLLAARNTLIEACDFICFTDDVALAADAARLRLCARRLQAEQCLILNLSKATLRNFIFSIFIGQTSRWGRAI